MKAFKQINLNIENRMVFSYAAILCFLCSFIILNPLFGQEKEDQNSNKPEVKIDVQKEFDEQGNVVGYDSSYNWYWSGKEFTNMSFDSIFEHFHDDFNRWNNNFERNHFKPFGYFHYQGKQWNRIDSSLYADLEDLFDEEFMARFSFESKDFQFYDSTLTSLFDFEEFDQNFKIDDFLGNKELFEKLNRNQEKYMDRIKEYQKEHQQLIEKYFIKPKDNNDPDIKIDQNKYSPKNKNVKSDKTGRI